MPRPNAHLAFPGDLATPTGGYGYDRRVIEASGGALRPWPLPASFPFPTETDLAAARDALTAADGPVLIDGLAFGAMPADLIDSLPRPPVALCHHPLGLEAGHDAATAARLIETERAALSRAAHIIVTSPATRATLIAEFSVPDEKITVAEPGLDQAPPARGPKGAPVILTVASLTPRKAHDVLVDALAQIDDRKWRAVWVGPETFDAGWTAEVASRIVARGLVERIDRRGPLDAGALAEAYDAATIFCLPSRYEGYGMAFAEAMMRALPIVACAAGAVPDTVPAAAGRLAPPDDASALAAALSDLLDNEDRRQTAARAARAHAQTLPGWDETWARIRAVLEAAP